MSAKRWTPTGLRNSPVARRGDDIGVVRGLVGNGAHLPGELKEPALPKVEVSRSVTVSLDELVGIEDLERAALEFAHTAPRGVCRPPAGRDRFLGFAPAGRDHPSASW